MVNGGDSAGNQSAGDTNGANTAELLAGFEQRNAAMIQESNAKVARDLHGTVTDLVTRLEANNQRQICALHEADLAQDARISTLEQKIEAVLKNQEQIFTQVSTCSRAMGVAAASPESVVMDQEIEWSAAPNTGILRVHSHNLLSSAVVRESLAAQFSKAGLALNLDYTVEGSELQLSQNWIVSFAGLAGGASRKCKSAHLSMRLGPRNWTQLFVLSPTGVSTQLYISPDKNREQITTEILTKAVGELISGQLGTRFGPIDAARREGLVFADWVPMCQVVPDVSGSVELKWNPLLLTSTGVNKDLIKQAIEGQSSKGAGKGKGAGKLTGISWVS